MPSSPDKALILECSLAQLHSVCVHVASPAGALACAWQSSCCDTSLVRSARVQVSVSNESLATLAVGNGQDEQQRVALKDLHVQLLDEHGNAAKCIQGEGQVCPTACVLRLQCVVFFLLREIWCIVDCA